MSMIIRCIEKRPLISVVFLIGLMLLPYLHLVPVSIMEARNFITAREMVTDGNWLLTTMNGMPRYEKPPLPTWLSAIAGHLGGLDNLWAMRLPSVMMIMVISVVVFFFSKALKLSLWLCGINSFITATSFYVTAIIFEAPWDIYTHGFMLIALLHLYYFFNEEKHSLKNILLAGILGGFSFLSKGPISMYALMLPFLLAFGVNFSFRQYKGKIFGLLASIVLMLVVGGWWYVYVRWQDPETFVAIAQKETSNWGSYNVRPFYYYWSFFAQSGLWTIPALVALIYPYMKKRVSNLQAYRFSLLWTLFSVLLLSLVPEKKTRYLMPVLIPLSINTGFYIEYICRRFSSMKKSERIPVYLDFGLISFAGLVIPLGLIFIEKITNFNFWWVLIFSVFPLMGIIMFRKLIRKEIIGLVYGAIALYVFIFLLLPPLYKNQLLQSRQRMEIFKNMVKEEQLQVFAYGYIPPEAIWFYGDKIPFVENPDDLLTIQMDNFALLTNVDIANEDWVRFFEVEEKTVLDLNNFQGKNNRLISRFYVLHKKVE